MSSPQDTPSEFVDVEIDVAIDADGAVSASGPSDDQTAAGYLADSGAGCECVQSYTVKLRLAKPRRHELDGEPVAASIAAEAAQ